ncbi:hypothetical protein BJX65DRAFT_312763 [Aspergillus insuetus]
MATNKVLCLVELLELILLNLSMRDLLLAQRVCRQWRACIRSTARLKQKLFLETPHPCPRPDIETDLKVEINPLLQETFPTFFTHLETLDRGIFNNTKADNSTLKHERLSLLRVASSNPSLKAQAWYEDSSKRAAVLRHDASWRRMYPSHPPPRLGDFHAEHIGCGCGAQRVRVGQLGERHQRFNRSPGARMWFVWDATVFFRDEFPEGYFSVSWWRRSASPVGSASDRARGEDDPEPADIEKTWILELVVDTQPTWDCYRAGEGYTPTPFGIAKHENLIGYDDYRDVMANITRYEAPPVSVMRKFVREAKARIDAASDRDWLDNRSEDSESESENPDTCSTDKLYDMMEHYDRVLKKMLPARPR